MSPRVMKCLTCVSSEHKIKNKKPSQTSEKGYSTKSCSLLTSSFFSCSFLYCKMKIFVITAEKNNMSFEVEPTDSIEQLKLQIMNSLGIRCDAFRLFFNGRQLCSSDTINHYNITNESTLHIPHRFRECNFYHSLGTDNNQN